MLELIGAAAAYGAVPALRDITVRFQPGEVLAVVGPNGGGKSTLLRAAAGLHPLSKGERLLDGVPANTLAPQEQARRISYLPQSRNVPDITALRLVLHGRFPHMRWPRHIRREDIEIAEEALRDADAAELGGCYLKELSGGQRQKVYIAMALAQQTDTILLDEPTTYLDIAHQLQVTELARRLAAQGKAVGLVLHDLPLALRCAHRLLVLRAGECAGEGTPEEVFRSGVLDEVFDVSFTRMETAEGARYFCERR